MSKTTLEQIRTEFPLLKQSSYGYPLAYLDNAATTQKPQQVIDTLQKYYLVSNANVHRGVHHLTAQATELYENARSKISHYIGADKSNECIFVRGTTEAINLVAYGFTTFLKPQDEIIISQIEHHSNIVPWQVACERTGALLRIIPCNEQGELDLTVYRNTLNERTKLVAITHVSNALGTINPIKEMIQWAHDNQTPVLIDGAQALAHLRIDVKKLDCDFYAFSAHKMYGPTGIGMLYGKAHWLEQLPPFQTGGDMIETVTFDKTTFNQLPYKFEAGTPAIADAIAFGTAVEYLENLDFQTIQQHEEHLLTAAMSLLGTVPNISFYGNAANKAALISFTVKDIHPHDIGTMLDQKGIAVRTGHLCAQPTMQRFGLNAMVRASFGLYNTLDEVERLTQSLLEIEKLFKR
jgi:cysteine desulfurase/selenocysteine lyase